MKRSGIEDQLNAGYDSFLDTVTNIVGILIILVMVVGVRAQHAPLSPPPVVETTKPPEDDPQQERLKALSQRAANLSALRHDVLELAQKVEAVRGECLARGLERDRLALAVSLLEKELAEKAEHVSQESARRNELLQAIAQTEERIRTLQQATAEAETRSTTVQIVNYPTPLAVPVDHEEIHFMIRGGKITYIPLETLLEELVADAKKKLYRLFDVPEITGSVGPIGGFRLEYSVVHRSLTGSDREKLPGAGGYAQLRRWVLVPEADVGEPVADALNETSEFRRRIAGYRPDKTSVTIWCYPDGFRDFRRLKDYLQERGYAVAGRPLPEGFPITGSPQGTKSAAQ